MKSEQLVSLLVTGGASLELRDSNGITPLQQAVVSGNPSIVGLLVRAGADMSVRFADGMSLRERAVTMGFDSVVAVLEDLVPN